MSAAIMRKGQRGLVKRTSKRPPTTDGSASACAMADGRAVRQHGVGVQEQERVAPRDARAPAFIWRARPRELATSATDGKRRTTSAVPSVLPPSDDDDLHPGQRATRSGRSRSRFAASSARG